MKSNKLPGLNGLRAIAASFVLVGHIYQIAGNYGVTKAEAIYQATNVGADMVNLFFVISGFIITYTLLKEKKSFGDISLKNFYIKRILRIWPLYFLIYFVIYILSNHTTYYSRFDALNGQSTLFFSLFLVNFYPFINFPQSVLAHYWSLSVEEQFYLIWPQLFRKFNPVIIAFSVLLMIAITRNLSALMLSKFPNKFWEGLTTLLIISRLGSMAIGALGALMLDKIKNYGSFIFWTPLQITGWLIFLASIIFKVYIPYVHFEVMGFLYLYLIINVTSNPKPLISLESKFFDWTGSISYGIYMYHWPLIPLIIVLLQKTGIWEFSTSYYLIPLILISYVATYIIATISYKYVEMPILKLKPHRHISSKPYLTSNHIYEGNYSGRR